MRLQTSDGSLDPEARDLLDASECEALELAVDPLSEAQRAQMVEQARTSLRPIALRGRRPVIVGGLLVLALVVALWGAQQRWGALAVLPFAQGGDAASVEE